MPKATPASTATTKATVKSNSKTVSKPNTRATSVGGKRKSDPVDQSTNKRQKISGSSSAPKGHSAGKKGGKPGRSQTYKNKLNNAIEINQSKPAPYGRPPAWAEGRQALCESLPYYRGYQMSAYTFDHRVFGVMLDFSEDNGSYMDEEIIIHRTGGGCVVSEDGVREQVTEHKREDATVKSFLWNWEQKVPLAVIIGSKNTYTPSAMPYRYNVLDWFYVTHVWPEPNGRTIAFRVRLQKANLSTKSWWAASGTALPADDRDFESRATKEQCPECSVTSSQVYKVGWVCLNEKCSERFELAGHQITDYTYNPNFLNERFDWNRKHEMALVEEPMPNGDERAFSRVGWAGLVCARCGRCNSATEWYFWKCEAEGCGWKWSIDPPILSHKVLQPLHGYGYVGHAPSKNICRSPFKAQDYQIHGNLLTNVYDVLPGCFIAHLQSNNAINSEQGGAHDVFRQLQEGSGIPLQRVRVKSGSMIEGPMLTKHFAVNYGAPYDYVADVGMKSFAEAPKAIMKALGRLTWAGKFAFKLVGMDGCQKPNELLAVGYKEGNEMNYHDDGEPGLGPTVTAWSLGGDADFNFRMKQGYYSPSMMDDIKKYDPNEIVLEGSRLWEERRALNAKYGQISDADFEAEKKRLYTMYKADKSRKTCEAVLKMKLKHGDFVVMHGADIQTYFEHAGRPTDKLRFVLTARNIDLNQSKNPIPKDEHWKADFTLSDDDIYDPKL